MLFENIFANGISVVLAVFLIIIAYYKWSYTYWSSRSVPYKTPSIPFGNVNLLKLKQGFGIELADFYVAMKSKGFKYAGYYIFSSPQLIPMHPELIKNIMLKDFSHFVNHGVYYNEEDDPLSAHLFALEDDKWRNLRAKLTPAFTSGKIKTMLQLVIACADPMVEKLRELSAENEAVDIKEMFACFTTDVIGSCAFGVECNSFKTPDSAFRKYGKADFDKRKVGFTNLTAIFPNLSKKLGIKLLDEEITAFFKEVVRTSVELRQKNNTRRNDFIQLLLDLGKDEEGLTLNQMAAQAYAFFIAGFETSSTTMTYCLFELAQNTQMQDKLRIEITACLSKYNGCITYDGLAEMKYLSQVIHETLRKYPPAPIIPQLCNKTYHDSENNLTIEKGIGVLVPIYGLHHDPEYFPNPKKFDPDRFSDENKDNINPFAYLPFGAGPRMCIGKSFGIIQMKVGLVAVLNSFKLGLNKKTPKEFTFVNANFLITKETIFLDLIEI